MEWKIGEIKQVNGEWYQCVESQDGSCKHCDVNFEGKCPIPIKECTESGRSDKSYVIFKKLEKVGQPTMLDGKLVQKILTIDKYSCNGCCFESPKCDKADNDLCCEYEIYVEIKQTKEEMEEKKLNLKPFDIQKAREGKPVCTRDGRKARIICFDAKDNLPIIALITNARGDESLARYKSNGRFTNLNESDCDLMMLPEKRSGWVNVYNNPTTHNIYTSADVFESKEIAEEQGTQRNRIATCKITWEE